MAEQVNQRIEGMINELEQMRRTNLYEDDEIREISRKRKEFEYKIQRRIKEKSDFVQYIAFELALLEDISLRRKQAKLGEKKKDIEYAIAKRLNKVFKQFIFRFQNDIAIYFEYIKFCQAVGFDYAVSAIIDQMLRVHGDKPKTWQLASKWESKEQNNLENARNFLLKGIHRHPNSDILYLDLFDIELMIAFKTEDETEKAKNFKRADVVWRNGMKNIPDVNYLFKLCDISLRYGVNEDISNSIKQEIWNRRSEKRVWSYIASKELEGYHWKDIEEYVSEEFSYSKELNYYIAVYEEALMQFPDENLSTMYIHGLLGLKDNLCTDLQKICAVKQAWFFSHENGLLSNDMYVFGIKMLKLEGEITETQLTEVLDTALAKNPLYRYLWEEKILLHKNDEDVILKTLKDATKILKTDDVRCLWNFVFDNIESHMVFKNCYSKLQSCESVVFMTLKPTLLKKMYEHNGLKAARQVYEECIRTPPTQEEVHSIMIDIEMNQEKPSLKNVRKCYEALVQHHGKSNIKVWMDYINFEQKYGNAQAVPSIHRRAIGMLDKNSVDDFIKAQTLAKLN
ncbi:u3 small nucleolar RNA-associated protein 6 [Danaus plexippus plexippus]|uniref:U3 small nucleolar RNA-associated protein 6 n=1 Tax=Danaus plexippus plexippus TaxID=278856 RepID=A0A212ERY2_DANPL|nr:u3 small nucleolar RNA-associated protein 6 [Danaus plexippus plexippus]